MKLRTFVGGFWMIKRIVVDTNIILNCPQLLRSLTAFCDFVYIPRTVIYELNHQKDHAETQKRTLASLCLGMLIELKSDSFIIDDTYSSGSNNDDRILGTAKAIAKDYISDMVYLLSDDKDFKLKNLSGISNLQVINSKEFDVEFKNSINYDIRASQCFFDAVKHRDIEQAKKSLSTSVNLNFVESESGYTPLIYAIRNRDFKMINWLISIPEVDINKGDEKKYKIPPISHAIQINNPRLVKNLIAHGANVNEPSLNDRNYYNTPLMIAAWGGNLELVKILVENGACINQVDKGNGFTALIKAVFKNNPDVVEFLLTCHADATICSFEKMTALDYAYAKNVNGEYEAIIAMLNA